MSDSTALAVPDDGDDTPPRAPQYRKLTRRTIAAGINAARAGAAQDDIAAVMGVHRASLYRWLAEGRAESDRRLQGEPANSDLDPVCDLYDGVRAAQARLAVRMNLRVVEAADRGEWRAALAYLQRFPHYAAAQDAAGALGPGSNTADGVADLADSELTEAQAREIVRAMTAFGEGLLAVVEDANPGVDCTPARARFGQLAREALLGEAGPDPT